MTPPSYGATSRQPVYSGNRRIPGLWQRTTENGTVVYEVRQHLGGKLRRVRLEAITKTDAIAEQRRLAVDYERGEPSRSPAAALTLSDLSADWLLHLESRINHRDPRQRRSPRTIALNRQRLGQWILPDLGYVPPNDLTLTHIRRLIDKMTAKGLAPSTVTGTINILSALLQWAVRNGHATRNIIRDLDRNDRPGSARLTEPRYLTDNQVQLLLGKMGDTFRPIAATLAYAGLRISEALGLRWRDLDLKNDTLTVSAQLGLNGERVPVKTPASAATVPMLPALKRGLTAHRDRQKQRDPRLVQRDALVFTTANGHPHTRRNALRAVNNAATAAGLNSDGREPVGPHDLRHSLVGIAFDHGATLPEVSRLARHANARVTAAIYAGLTDDAHQKVTKKLLDGGFGA